MFLLAKINIVERILDLIRPLFANWGYLLVFLFAFLERSFLVGLVVPGSAIVLLGGIYAGQGDLNIALVILLAFVGSLAGDNLGYLIGLKLGLPLIEKHGDFMRLRARVRLSEQYFKKYGGVTVLIARFVAVLGTLACPVAGMAKMNYKKFLLYEFLGSTAWAVGFGLLGYFFGRSYNLIMKVFNYFGNALLLVIIGLLLAAYIIYLVREHRKISIELEEVEESGVDGEAEESSTLE